MGKFRMPLYAVVVLICFKSVTCAIDGNETDRLALLAFKKMITGDPFGVMLSWNATSHFCQWYGVTCGHRHQRVTVLDLQSLKLKGSLSPHIGNMTFLRNLSLPNNSFSHEIPQEIGYLRRLQVLNLRNNSMGGTIPSNLSACNDLVDLDVGNNNLVGEIPLAIGHLPKLERLYLFQNILTGNIPSSLGNLSSLVLLSIGFNSLFGGIPSSLGHLTNLAFLAVEGNQLTGNIPRSIFNLSNIDTLDVSTNRLKGNLPMDMFTSLPKLQFFHVFQNGFTGPIPVSVSNASNIVYFEIDTNEFTGKVPSLEKLHRLNVLGTFLNLLGTRGAENDFSFVCSLTNATDFEFLLMQFNNFGGALPSCMSNITSLVRLGLGPNWIYGSIPMWIGSLINLEALGMRNTQLSGPIPPSIGRLHKLQVLVLSQNKLKGNIPSSLGNLSLIFVCYLNENNLQGSIPSNIRNCKNLLRLDVSQNKLGGAIPLEVMRLSTLISLILSHNNFTGALPSEVGDLKILDALDVSENRLSGNIPSGLGGCTSLEYLLIRGNLFQGQIPPALSSLRGLQIIDFSRNNLSGEIPKFLASFDLKKVNLSYNNFEGAVPKEGIFANKSATSVVGNTKLCGGIPEFHLPACNTRASKKKGWPPILKFGIFIVLGILGILVLAFLFWIQFKKKTKKVDSRNPSKSFLKVSYQSLLKATGGFSSANLIGVGSFGSVYKGILDQDGTIIAVKVFDILRQGASRSFIAECEALRNIRHRNLVKILTVCSSIDYHGKDFKALVYEFMANGNLEEWLHPSSDTIKEANEAPRTLNFLQRLNIAIDVASALEYLHLQCETVIVHCDLKPSNVLLDVDMTGHVGDFGLAKILSENIPKYSANPASSLGLRGTVGYAPPEYGMGSEISTSGDIYSYGILLLEMFTGKKPTNEMFRDGLNLNNFVEVGLHESMVEIVDPILLKEICNKCIVSTIRKERALECLTILFRVGIACSAEEPRKRMNISDVVVELHSIMNKTF